MNAVTMPRSLRALTSVRASATSLNGWAAIPDPSDPRMASVRIAGHTLHLRKEVMPVFLSALRRINAEVLPLAPGPLDSWEYRDARLGGGLSNHASGTAVDFRYDVLRADHQVHMTPAQRRAMERILDSYQTADGHRLFGWGGEWTPGRACDEMHLEVGQRWQVGRAITPGDFTQFVARHHLRPDGTTGPAPVTPPTPHPPTPTAKTVHLHLLRPGQSNAEVRWLQQALKRHGFDPGPLDGQFGPRTQRAVQQLQRSMGFTGFDADGVPGRRSLGRLGFQVSA
jgi:hypothetical protein